MNGAELIVSALENEGVQRIFGVPGEENLDVVEALRRSRIELVLTRHEQAAAFMAATHGRLTGKPGVCITTLGPGALNLTTGAAYALLGAMPMVMITGQKGILSRKQAGFQVVDIVATMTPLTKMADQIVSPATIPTMVREAFRVAQQERPGPVHLELPEDIAARDGRPTWRRSRPTRSSRPIAPNAALDRAAELIWQRRAAADHAGRRGEPAAACRRAVGIRAAGADSVLQYADGQGRRHRRVRPLHGNRGAIGARLRSSGDRSGGSDHRHRPRHGGEAAVLHGPERADGAACRLSAGHRRGGVLSASRAHRRRRAQPHAAWPTGSNIKLPRAKALLPLREDILAHIADRAEESRYPPTPQRIVHDVRQVMPEDGIVCLDNGMYKIWFARNYRTHVANTLLLDNALATMGAGLPSAIMAACLNPDRRVLAVCGDGGFMMNSQELETAVRLKLNLVVLVLVRTTPTA